VNENQNQGITTSKDRLLSRIGKLADQVRNDSRWIQDDLSVSILGILLYGLALAAGRAIFFLDMEDIDAVVVDCLTKHVGAAEKWSRGFVAEANRSAFNKAHHAGQFELIGVGHSYIAQQDQSAVIENVFTNLANFRRHATNAG
jgi:hypothetical protein